MSSHHHMGRAAPNGEIEHMSFLSDHIGALYLNDEYSDVVLTVDGQHFNGHKVILAARSEYFRALLFGGLRESKQAEVELKGTSLKAFKALLKYIYTGHMSLANQKEDVILETLGLAHQYGFVDLEESISDYLCQILQIRNVCMIFDAARLYQLQFLSRVCCSFMDKHAQEIIHHESFLQLSHMALKEIVQRDSFYAPEVEIFQAVVNWVQANQTEGMESSCMSHCSKDSLVASTPTLTDASSEILGAVRLPLMSLSELLTVVRPTNLIPPDTILDAIAARNQGRDSELRYRGVLLPEENMAWIGHGSQVLQGEMRSALLDGDSKNYDMERGYTRHAITDSNDSGILIKLGTEAILNHFKMLLWDKDARSYQYYIEVSMDQKDWIRVIDHTRYFCRSWQFLYFEPRVVRYIHIVGTNNTINKVFHVVSFEAMYSNTPFTLEKGLVVPKHNIATVERSASVIEGVSRSRNTLLNGDTSNYDWDSGYTCHQLGSGAILVQLGQPYMLDSMRLLLWDCDDRRYSYYVEVAVNPWNWELVVDKSHEMCRSWQTLHFERRPVVFVRIVGTHNTANEVFHCVHFECPAQSDDSRQQQSETCSIKLASKSSLPGPSSSVAAIAAPLHNRDSRAASPTSTSTRHQYNLKASSASVAAAAAPAAAAPPAPAPPPTGQQPSELDIVMPAGSEDVVAGSVASASASTSAAAGVAGSSGSVALASLRPGTWEELELDGAPSKPKRILRSPPFDDGNNGPAGGAGNTI